MDVVFHAADEDGRAIELFGDAAEIRVERVARGNVRGLGNDVTKSNRVVSRNNPKGIVSISPRLRGTSYLGSSCNKSSTATRLRQFRFRLAVA
jgi:hypothetical protein